MKLLESGKDILIPDLVTFKIVKKKIYSGAKNKSDKAHLGHFLEFTISNSEFEN